MRHWNLAIFCVAAVLWLATPVLADRVDIANPAGLGELVQNARVTLTGDFSVDLNVNVYYNPSNGLYTYVYTLSMPSSTIGSPAFTVNHGGLFDMAGLNWGLITDPLLTSGGVDLLFAGVREDGSTYFIFSDMEPGDTITVYGQSTMPPEDLLAGLLEDLTHRGATGTVPSPVPEPGTLLLLGGGLSLASMAIRRRIGKRKRA